MVTMFFERAKGTYNWPAPRTRGAATFMGILRKHYPKSEDTMTAKIPLRMSRREGALREGNGKRTALKRKCIETNVLEMVLKYNTSL